MVSQKNGKKYGSWLRLINYLSKECYAGSLSFYAKEERSQHCSEIFGFMFSQVDCEIAALHNNKEDQIGKYGKDFLW